MRHLLEIHCLPVAERLLMSLVMLVALWESVFATLTELLLAEVKVGGHLLLGRFGCCCAGCWGGWNGDCRHAKGVEH